MSNAHEKHKRGVELYQAGRYQEALRALREALGDEDSSERWSDWASAQFALKNESEAEAGFAAALELDPANEQAALNLGALLSRQARHSEAVPYLQQVASKSRGPSRDAALQLLRTEESTLPIDSAQQIEEYLRRFVSADPNERSYFETHLQRYVATLQLLPLGSPESQLLELGAAFHHITPALVSLRSYPNVRCNDIWDGPESQTRHVTSNDGRESFEFRIDNFDVQREPWPYEAATFDAVLCCEMLEHLHSDPGSLASEINRILKPGGVLLLTTPNLGCAHAVEAALRGDSPYIYGKFERGGAPTDRHNREWTVGEVQRLAEASGFFIVNLSTHDSWWPRRKELLRSLAALGYPIARRGDNTFLLARKEGPVLERYPREFYSDLGTQAERRHLQVGAVTPPDSLEFPSHPRQNILIIHDQLPHHDCSGADLRLLEVVEEISRQGHRVTFLARDHRDSERYSAKLESLGIHVVAGDHEKRAFLGDEGKNDWSFRELLERERFDVAILTHWYWSVISVAEHYLDDIRHYSNFTAVAILTDDRHGERERRLAKLSGHFSDEERGNDFEQRELEVYDRADLVLYITETDRDHYLRLLPGLRVEHLPMTARTVPSSVPFEERSGFLFLGNFENLANQDALQWLLDEVWPVVLAEMPDARLYVAGHGSTRALKGSQPSVISLGQVEDLSPLFAQRRVFASPIRYGTGINTKNVHAMAHGLPVVTTAIGAEGMQLQAGVQALVADHAVDFAKSLLLAYRDSALWKNLATNGSQFIKNQFSAAALCSQVQKILLSCAGLPRKSFDSDRLWSFRSIEQARPEVLTQTPDHYRPILRTLGYWQLGRQELDAGRPGLALTQFRHVFAFVRGRVPATVFHLTLLEDMAAAYRQLGDVVAAQRCAEEIQASKLARPHRLPSSGGKARKNGGSRQRELSVVLPTYNRSATLRLCLAALAFQSLPAQRWEVVVVDDGSTDGTKDVCCGRPLPFALQYSQQLNRGAGAARKAGVEIAKGELLLLCNDDTVAATGLLEEHLRIHRDNPREKLAVLGEFRPSVDCNRRALSLFVNRSEFFFPQSKLKEDHFYDQAYFVTCNLSVRRDAVLAAGNFDPHFRVAEDTEMGTRMAARGFRVRYSANAVAWHEHAVFTSADLIRRAAAYGRADWDLFRKHPKLLGKGDGPFGLLNDGDQQRIADRVAQQALATAASLSALKTLDELDFRAMVLEQPEGSALAEELMRKVAEVTPLVYWHHLLDEFLRCWRSAKSVNTQSGSPAAVPAPSAEACSVS